MNAVIDDNLSYKEMFVGMDSCAGFTKSFEQESNSKTSFVVQDGFDQESAGKTTCISTWDTEDFSKGAYIPAVNATKPGVKPVVKAVAAVPGFTWSFTWSE